MEKVLKKSYWDKSLYKDVVGITTEEASSFLFEKHIWQLTQGLMKSAVLVNADNIKEYIDLEYIKKSAKSAIIMPPFNSVWIEVTGNQYEEITGPLGTIIKKQGAYIVTAKATDYHKKLVPAAEYVSTVLEFADTRTHGVASSPATAIFYLNSKGNCLNFQLNTRDGKGFSDEEKSMFAYSCTKYMYMLSLFHAKGVPTESKRSKICPSNKKVKGKTQFIEVVEKVILITPDKKVYNSKSAPRREEDKEEGDGLHHGKRQHLCRGHFSHYGETNKLFGRFVGTIWIPSHVRGSSEKGKVKASYELVK